MLWFSMTELDLCVGLLMVILYGLTNLRNKHLELLDVQFVCQCWPVLAVTSAMAEAYTNSSGASLSSALPSETVAGALSNTWLFSEASLVSNHSYDVLLALITVVVLRAFKNFESLLLLMFAYVAQSYMMHSCDLVTFYVCLEAQNFAFLVLCGLQPDKRSNGFAVEAALKYLLLSAFSSGILLFAFASLYLQTGMTGLFLKSAVLPGNLQLEAFAILLALLFKLGCAPVHLWTVYIYQSIKRPLLMYISTSPKLSLFAFWASSWQLVWTDYTLTVFIVYTLVLGSLGAYGLASQPAVRTLFAYSTVSEIGFMLLAAETAGFHSLFQHLSIYIVTQMLVWNLGDKRLFSLAAISLAGLPPLAGFFGKAWILWHAVNMHMVSLLLIALACSVLSVVYYIRLLRLFWYQSPKALGQTLGTLMYDNTGYRAIGIAINSYQVNTCYHFKGASSLQVGFTSACVVALVFLPVFLVKPFVL